MIHRDCEKQNPAQAASDTYQSAVFLSEERSIQLPSIRDIELGISIPSTNKCNDLSKYSLGQQEREQYTHSKTSNFAAQFRLQNNEERDIPRGLPGNYVPRYTSIATQTSVSEDETTSESHKNGSTYRTVQPRSSTSTFPGRISPKRKRNLKKGHIPRPRNAFILYRIEQSAKVKQTNPELDNNSISKIVASQWHREDDGIKQNFFRRAEEERAEHEKKYPDYIYHSPKKKK